MRKDLLIVAVMAGMVLACNNNTEEKKATGMDTMDHASMNHDATSNMPAVPEVPAGAKVFFANLKDGEMVSSPFKVQMGVEGMSVDTANGIIKPASGHHHILIDGPDSLASGTSVPKDSVHLHFGNAQTETELKLSPGMHTLTLQFADALHRSYGGRLAAKITVNVKK
ncbi:MAG: DUF4399 domain-containing protein [Terrimonas sp.]|nr:DUF4399 domain-containing protein [Terrimonas sp.]